MHELQPPGLPDRLTPGQAAQMSEVLQFLHIKIRHLLASVQPEEHPNRITLDFVRWQSLLDLQTRLAGYLKEIAEPESREF